MKENGSVVYWGNPNSINDIYYQNAAELKLSGYYKFPEEQLRSNVKSISSTEHAYAAIKEDGSIISWGNSYYDIDRSILDGFLSSNVSQVFGNE